MNWRKLFGLCEHCWVHASNTIKDMRMVEIQYCTKCHKFRFRDWPND